MWEFLISLVIIIAFHLIAHLIAAKRCGCKVLEFGIGFGKTLYYKNKGTIYKINLFLLGVIIN